MVHHSFPCYGLSGTVELLNLVIEIRLVHLGAQLGFFSNAKLLTHPLRTLEHAFALTEQFAVGLHLSYQVDVLTFGLHLLHALDQIINVILVLDEVSIKQVLLKLLHSLARPVTPLFTNSLRVSLPINSLHQGHWHTRSRFFHDLGEQSRFV
jgi:hypothetical protein